MPRRSSVKLEDQQIKLLRKHLSKFISEFNETNLNKFLEEFLTDEERIMLTKRFALYAMLYSGEPLSSIQQKLGISRETTRIYSQIKDSRSEWFNNRFRNLYKAKNEDPSDNSFLKALDLIFESRSSSRARAKFLQGNFRK